MPRVLLIATTTGYQTRAFGEAATALGVDLVFATDRCDQLDDPWRDAAVAVRFHDETGSLAAIAEGARHQAIDGVLAVGDRPALFGAKAAHLLRVPGHPPPPVSKPAVTSLPPVAACGRRACRAHRFVSCWLTRISKRWPATWSFLVW